MEGSRREDTMLCRSEAGRVGRLSIGLQLLSHANTNAERDGTEGTRLKDLQIQIQLGQPCMARLP